MDIVISIASKIAESLVTPIGREFGYLIYYDTNMKDLKDELKQLFEMKDGVQELVNAAKRNGEVINSDVQSWLTSVNKLIQKVLHFEEEVNMKRRFLYRWNISKKATKITQDVRHLQKERTFNNNVAHPAPPPMIWSTFKEGFKDFKSRMTHVNRVIEVLKNEDVRMIGICGMGGVGKTTMVKEIIKRLAGLKVFDNVVIAVVSQSPSIRKIQSEIAEQLGFTYDKEDTESGRARRLYGRLMEISRILIVLDDVWTELDFEAIGLPSGLTHKGCKVLLTSRNLEVCNAMGSQEIFTIPVLTPEESWELFREIIGQPLDYPDLAKRVMNECAGLPIAILTVAKALENKRKYEWDDALKQLQSSAPGSISLMNDRVYSSIQWSYDRLESDEAKSCLLLCCLFPEDYDIPIEYLVRYGWGRGYFSNTDSVEEARNRVHSLVDKLQRRFLLLDSKLKDHTKMHDIVRDVAIQIASRDPHRFLIRCDAEKKGWPKIYDHYTTISLIPINIDEIPVGLDCPKLELLHLEGERYSENSMDIMCKGMKKLKVLALVDVRGISALPSSLGLLKSLRTLSLNGCLLTDISDVIGSLENLEILSFRECVNMLELPREIGLLKHLRLLDITDCNRLQKIPHGLLSSLSSLEELYMENSFHIWEQSAAKSEDKRMASLVEVMSLSNHLKVLVIVIPDFNFFPKDFYLTIQTTIRFHISNRTFQPWIIAHIPSTRTGCYAFENKLDIVRSDATEFMEIQTVQLLFKKCEDLILQGIKNLKYVLNELDQEGLQHLKVLRISGCPEIEYLVNGASWTQQTAFPLIQSIELMWMPELRAICHDQLPQSSFINLRSLELHNCPVLKYVFSLLVASNLVQLQSLLVANCPEMKEIVSKEWREHETASDIIAFPKLTNLTLNYLSDEFVGFYEANKLYSNHEVTTPEDQNVVGTSYDEHQSSRSFERAVFPSKCILWLQNLEEVKLKYSNVDVVFNLKGHMVRDGQAVPAFSHLQNLFIWESRCQHLWKNIPRGFQGFQNLRYLKIEYGFDLQYVFPHSIARLLVNLEELNIAQCWKMETIVRSADENEKEDQTSMTLFPKLNSFDLDGLLSLESLCPDASTSLWSAAKVMSVKRCYKLKTLASVIPQIKKLEKDSTAHHEDEDEGESYHRGDKIDNSKFGADPGLPSEVASGVKTGQNGGKTGTPAFRCKKCRRIVALHDNVVDHIPGEGGKSFEWRKRKSSNLSEDSECSSIFVEPLRWMTAVEEGALEGKLSCAHCEARLGYFNWSGSQCSCGSWITSPSSFIEAVWTSALSNIRQGKARVEPLSG
ncbi:PREDICTED: disease resistance [Prunus dulcis]|uniref:PREDICTED: disease resistance n=1 Tax=Prunus dulcis TaxID=3755 RepID=A0A5E4G598_PRUDU|nr:PREDICTED: disease resistance [Prunus dulcis]